MILTITLPIAAQNLIAFGVTLMDTVMVGRLGDIPLAACAQATQPGFVYQLLVFGLAGGGAVLCSQYWGKGDLETIRKVIGFVLRIAIFAAMLISVAVFFFPEKIMTFYLDTSTPEGKLILAEAVKYLKVIAFSYLIFGISMAFTTVIRSVEIVRASMLFSFISFVCNVFFNWVLIFGKLGFKPMGIRGAALGTLLARTIELVLILIFAFKIDKKLMFRVKYIFVKDKALFKDFVSYSVPVLLNELAWGVGMTVQAAIIGHISKEFLSANSIISVVLQLAMIVSFGIANASMVVVGKKMGEGDREGAKAASSTIMVWAVILGIISTFLIIFLRAPFASLFNVTPQTRKLAEDLMIITSVIIFFTNVSCIGIVGVLRGAGDTRFSLYLELLTLWLIAIPLGALTGLILDAPIYIVYICLRADEPIKAIVAFIRTTRDKTYKNLTR
jgi:putative MATE family efflux protein